MMIENYSEVVLLTNRFNDEGLHYGQIGYVIELHEEDYTYLVEFSDKDNYGTTIAIVVVNENEIIKSIDFN